MLIPFSELSPAIKKLMIINGVIFLLGAISPIANQYFGALFALDPAIILNFTPEYLFGKPWSVFTYMFLHGSFFHLFANMFFGLWMFGSSVAQQIGDKEFLKLYLISGTFAGIFSALFYVATGQTVSVIGASGATYAILYLFCKYNPESTVLFMFVIPMKVRTLFIVLLVVETFGALRNVFPGFQSDGVAHITHLFGLLGGFLYMKYLYKGSLGSGFQFQGTQDTSFSNFTDKVKQTFAKTTDKKDEHDPHSPHDSNEALDAILKKVSEYGINSLNEKEKQFLEKVSEQRRKQKGEGNIRNLDDYR
ncbi:MAG: rhomboid family intramembrane serine protease [Fibrobacterales bacterium]